MPTFTGRPPTSNITRRERVARGVHPFAPLNIQHPTSKEEHAPAAFPFQKLRLARTAAELAVALAKGEPISAKVPLRVTGRRDVAIASALRRCCCAPPSAPCGSRWCGSYVAPLHSSGPAGAGAICLRLSPLRSGSLRSIPASLRTLPPFQYVLTNVATCFAPYARTLQGRSCERRYMLRAHAAALFPPSCLPNFHPSAR
jgi:hypothetical protein